MCILFQAWDNCWFRSGHKSTLVKMLCSEGSMSNSGSVLTNCSYWFCKHENWAIYQAINITLHISQLNYRRDKIHGHTSQDVEYWILNIGTSSTSTWYWPPPQIRALFLQKNTSYKKAFTFHCFYRYGRNSSSKKETHKNPFVRI